MHFSTEKNNYEFWNRTCAKAINATCIQRDLKLSRWWTIPSILWLMFPTGFYADRVSRVKVPLAWIFHALAVAAGVATSSAVKIIRLEAWSLPGRRFAALGAEREVESDKRRDDCRSNKIVGVRSYSSSPGLNSILARYFKNVATQIAPVTKYET